MYTDIGGSTSVDLKRNSNIPTTTKYNLMTDVTLWT